MANHARRHGIGPRWAAPLLVLMLSEAVAAQPTHRTDVILLGHMPASRAHALYERVLGVAGGVRVVEGKDGRSLTVYDVPARLVRFRALLKLLDVPGGDALRIYVRPVVHRSASELRALLKGALGARVGKTPLTMVPEDRANRLIVRTTRSLYVHVIDPIARRLDVRADRGRAVRVTPGGR